MIIQPMSDLHADVPGFGGYPRLLPGVDAILVAGDTREGLGAAIAELRTAYPRPTELVAVAGNHEFWGSVWGREIDHGRRAAAQNAVRFLENHTTFIGRVRILGCTLWTDYAALGVGLRALAMRAAYDEVRDHKRIKWNSNPWQRFRPQEAKALHQQSLSWIESELARVHAGPTVVLTHFPPTLDAVEPRKRTIAAAAACSDLLPIVDRYQPDYWISGHTHVRMNIRRGRTRLISNPLGYPHESTGFSPDMTIEVDT